MKLQVEIGMDAVDGCNKTGDVVFTKINYVDLPYQSGNFICESAFCAMLDQNVFPSVKIKSDS